MVQLVWSAHQCKARTKFECGDSVLIVKVTTVIEDGCGCKMISAQYLKKNLTYPHPIWYPKASQRTCLNQVTLPLISRSWRPFKIVPGRYLKKKSHLKSHHIWYTEVPGKVNTKFEWVSLTLFSRSRGHLKWFFCLMSEEIFEVVSLYLVHRSTRARLQVSTLWPLPYFQGHKIL